MSTSAAGDQGALRPWHLFLVVSMIAASVAVWNSPDTRPATLVMVSFTAFAVCGVGVAAFLTLAPFAEEQQADPEAQALSQRARQALEREKALVLRAIKDLEFDRAMGKIADADFADMVGRLRARAAGVLQQLDADSGGYRAAIERDLRALVGTVPASAPVAASAAARAVAPRAAAAPAAESACPSCATANDHDARFCKRCGSPLAS